MPKLSELKDETLQERWRQRWKGVQGREALTFLGKLMFKAKNKVLEKTLNEIEASTVLEAGCGLGYTAEAFKKGDRLLYLGIDISPDAVQFCKNKGLNVIQKDLEEVTEEYDLVFSDGLLEHFLDFEPCARHLMRTSRKYVLLIQPNHDSFTGKFLAYLAELFRGKQNIHEYDHPIRGFINVFEKNSFRLERNYPIFFNVFRLLLFKKSIP